MNPRAAWAIFSARLRTLLQYRSAAWAGAVTQLFWGLLRVMILEAFFRSNPGSTQPMTQGQVVAYIWLSQAFLLLTFCQADPEVAPLIRNGSVAYEVLKPMDLHSLWWLRALAGRVAPLLMRGLPILIIAFFFFHLSPPPGAAAAALFCVSIALAILLSSVLVVLVTLTLFWTISGDGISRLLPPLIFIGSGMILPLPFFPDAVQPLLNALPFRGLIDVPFRIYLGHLGGRTALLAIAQQASWVLVLALVGRALLSRGLRRLEISGG